MISPYNYQHRSLVIERKKGGVIYTFYNNNDTICFALYDQKKGRYIQYHHFYKYIDYERFIYNLCKKIEKNNWNLKYSGLHRKIYVRGRFVQIPAPDLCFHSPD